MPFFTALSSPCAYWKKEREREREIAAAARIDGISFFSRPPAFPIKSRDKSRDRWHVRWTRDPSRPWSVFESFRHSIAVGFRITLPDVWERKRKHSHTHTHTHTHTMQADSAKTVLEHRFWSQDCLETLMWFSCMCPLDFWLLSTKLVQCDEITMRQLFTFYLYSSCALFPIQSFFCFVDPKPQSTTQHSSIRGQTSVSLGWRSCIDYQR